VPLEFGIGPNRPLFLQLLLQVLLVGMTIGMMRTVVPALAETEYGVARNSFMLLSAFVLAFGVVKAVLNLVAGKLAERIGRKKVLVLGWLVALPIPVVVWLAPSWNWIVFATVLLGVNQGLCWSMTQAAKLDITRADERGLTMGLNEFAGYLGVAVAGIVTAYAATALGPRSGLLVFGAAVIVVALVLAVFGIEETLPWARSTGVPAQTGRWAIFALVSWRDRRMAVLSQAGLVEKFVDALVWVFFPVFLFQRGESLPDIGWIIGVYGVVWGGSQLLTGRLSDRIGRHAPNVAGMWLCALGVALMLAGEGTVWWSACSAIMGFGMALLYPNLSAAVADIAHPAWRGTAIGVYRFWRDLGYAVGAMGLGLAARFGGGVEAAFVFVAASMLLSGSMLFLFGEETLPRVGPAP
jgi:MFS family permease